MTIPLRTKLVLEMKSDQLGEFFPLLQQGVSVTVRVGCALDRLLASHWDISADYVTQRITTIFLNGRAIDDVTTAIVKDGAVIALSGAMPGLVGATMRRGGYYAAMRGGITYREDCSETADQIGAIRMKLFNLLLPELGPQFLRRGVILGTAELAAFLETRPESFWRGCGKVLLNDSAVSPAMLRDPTLINDAEVAMTVIFGEQP